jgi:hypothetical protein
MTAMPPTLPTTAPATTGGEVLLSLFGFVVPFRAPFGMPVAALPDAPGTPPTIAAVGAEKPELELENAVDEGNEDELEDRDDESRLRLRLELDDGLSDNEDNELEDPEDAPATLTVVLFPVIALIIAGRGPEWDVLMLAAKSH